MSTTSPRDRGEAEATSQQGARGPALRRSQRARILLGMTRVASAEGYAATTIAKVIAEAGISRPTFYEHFDSKGACFLAVQRQITTDLLKQVRVAVAQGEPARAAESAVRCLVEFAISTPQRARLLLCESLEAGPAELEERDRVVDAIAGAIDRTQARCDPRSIVADLPSWTLTGTALWLIAQRLRRSSGNLHDMADEIVGWIGRYERPLGEHRWRTLDPGPPPPPSAMVSELPSAPAAAPAPGQRGLSREEVKRTQRERILHATALVASRDGYKAMSVTGIMAEADVDKRTFYSAFANKQAAFMAAHELSFQHAMAVTARAFFGSSTWPERIWEGLLAGTQFHATHPTLAHVLHVQPYAIDRRAIERINQAHVAFTIFQYEGNQLAAEPLDETAMQAVVAACSEIEFLCLREGRSEQIPLMTPVLAYLCLAPYIGPAPAEELIDAKMAASATVVLQRTSNL
jgi:AcrR family transcriptional regulator